MVMHFDPAEIAKYLCCPDDGSGLSFSAEALHCVQCSRRFPFRSGNLVELLPSRPVELTGRDISTEYKASYLQASSQPWSTDHGVLPFGAQETLSPQLVRRRQRQMEQVFRLFGEGGGSTRVFCDLSAGAGHMTFAAAPFSRLIFHCDLSMDAVRYA